MDERCKQCPLICKRLDCDEFPVCYTFARLTPKQVINLVESAVSKFAPWHQLKIERSAQSAGDQLTGCSVRYLPCDLDNQIVLMAQSVSVSESRSYLWFRFGVPDSCCQQSATRGLSTMIGEVLEEISQSEWLISRVDRHEQTEDSPD